MGRAQKESREVARRLVATGTLPPPASGGSPIRPYGRAGGVPDGRSGSQQIAAYPTQASPPRVNAGEAGGRICNRPATLQKRCVSRTDWPASKKPMTYSKITWRLGSSSRAKPAAQRSSSHRTAGATPAPEVPSDAQPTRKRRPMSAKEKKALSERMRTYWAERRKKARK